MACPRGGSSRHFALRLALVPMVAVMGLGLGDMISNAVFVEIIFARPGLGTHHLQRHPEPQLSRSCRRGILFIVLIYVSANLLVDLVNALLDPRIARSLKQAA